MPPFPTDMKKLLSLPPNVVDCFHTVSDLPTAEYFCTSDPVDCKLGSGGGTTWLLEEAALAEGAEDFDKWLAREKRILLHAGGQSRRLPAYAACGKVLLPVPVFRWARGQRLDQTLLSLQLPLYERIMAAAPDSLRTLVASGDVYIRATEPLLPIPEADVVCYGLWADPASARNHGVFFMHRDHPERLDFMLQKPSIEQQHELASTHLSLMDLGIWLLSDRAVSLLRRRSFGEGGDREAVVAAQAHPHEGLQAQVQARRIDLGAVAADHPLALQPLHPAQAGRGRQVHALGQLGIGQAAVALQFGEHDDIGAVQFDGCHCSVLSAFDAIILRRTAHGAQQRKLIAPLRG